jgi:4-amino-4-deoxy-L-arabinose transferase-like glycosyltransferase
MGRDLTTSAAIHQDSENTQLPRASGRPGAATLPNAARLLAAMALGALLLALVYQIPTTHTVDIGGYDSAYVQGFFDPERDAGTNHAELLGSDGSARWTRATSYLLFPQAGLPAQLTLRMRGWRPTGALPSVQVLLNGTTVLDQFRAGADWEERTFQISGGLLKPNDVVIEIRSATAHIGADDPREVGVLIDRAIFHSGPAPIIPYPPQLLYGALAAGMLYILLGKNTEHRTENTRSLILRAILGAFVLCLLFFVLYRSQPPYPYPLLRLLPAINGVLAALLALRYGPALARRVPALLDAVAIGGIGVWTAAVLASAQQHVTLALPSVEGDFRVFALRSAHLIGQFPAGTNNPAYDGVLRADGFYNQGYPLLLWLTRPFTSDNPFLAARLIAALSGALLLLAGWWLARRLLGRSAALLALMFLSFSPLVVQYALYLGTDMPFAAACALTLALLMQIADCRLQIADYESQTSDPSTSLRTGDQRSTVTENRPSKFILNFQFSIFNSQCCFLIAAGLAAGVAFLIRHPGLLLLPFGWLVIWLLRDRSLEARSQSRWQKFRFSMLNAQYSIFLFTIAFLLAITPQLYVNLRDTGNPLFNQQAKNVWQAVFGAGDWGRWAATANDITLGRVIAQDPARFVANWWANVRGYVGTGGEDTREFGQATQLRLLSFPANWLAIIGLLGWLIVSFQSRRQTADGTSDALSPPAADRESQPVTFSPSHLVTRHASRVTRHASRVTPALLAWVALYVLTISIGLAPQARFFLPLTPIYALAAAWTITRIPPANDPQSAALGEKNGLRRARAFRNFPLIAGIALLVLLWGGFASGAAYVTRARTPSDDNAPGQPADEVAAAGLVLQTLRSDQRLVLQPPPGSLDGLSLGKYSAIADRVVPAPATDDIAALRATGASYLLRATMLGPVPGGLEEVGSAGGYTLYTITR